MKTIKWTKLIDNALWAFAEIAQSPRATVFNASVSSKDLFSEAVLKQRIASLRTVGKVASKTKTQIQSVDQLSNDLRQQCEVMISRWDIRRAQGLVDIFPSIMPKKAKIVSIDRDENGDWAVYYT